MKRRVLMLFAVSSTALLVPSRSYGQQVVRFNQDIQYDDLPEEVRRSSSPYFRNSDAMAVARNKPSLELDGANLFINPPTVGLTQTLTVSSLLLKNGALIVTNGLNVEILAETIEADANSGIISFLPQEVGRAQPGSNGESGISGGSLLINAELPRRDSRLKVNLSGMAGQDGGDGLPGPRGVEGRRGDNGADHLFDCAHGGGAGGSGGPGGEGGEGGAGGAGGDGGKLILRGPIATQRLNIEFVADGGRGGRGGAAGPGGPGGPPGQGGSGTTFCRGGAPGPQGPPGLQGKPGQAGIRGRSGTILADY